MRADKMRLKLRIGALFKAAILVEAHTLRVQLKMIILLSLTAIN